MRRGKSGSGRKGASTIKASAQPQTQPAVGCAHMASQTSMADPATAEEDHFQALMQAISGCQTTLTEKIYTLQMDFGLLRRDMDKMQGRMGEAEGRVGDAEDSIRDHRASIHTLQIKVKALESRAEDSENRSWRNNLRVVGLPQGAEGQDPTAFTEHLLRTLLPQAQFSPRFVVERAHRMPPVWGQPGAPPTHLHIQATEFPGPRRGTT